MYRIFIIAFLSFAWLNCKNDTNATTQDAEPIEVNNSPDDVLKDSIEQAMLNADVGPERVVWQKPEVVISKMGDLTDKTVADVGAGVGFFTFRLLQTAKKVVASDIDTSALHKMEKLAVKLDSSISSKLKIVVATESDPNLGKEKVDIIFICNTYVYIANRINYLKNLKKYLLPGGRIYILDYKQKNMPFGPDPDQKIALYVVEDELTKAGYQVIQADDMSLDYQYIVIAKMP